MARNPRNRQKISHDVPTCAHSDVRGSGGLIGLQLFGKGGVLGEAGYGYVVNLYTDASSVVITVGVIEALNRRREEQRHELERLKARLKKLVRSPSNKITTQAIAELRQRGWIAAGWLIGVYLSHANLQKADLHGADLQGARLTSARAQGANFAYADLQGVSFLRTKLRGASLLHAEMQGTNVKVAEFDETTILPDGSQWTPEVDLSRFTDADHPQFWRSDDPNSPAYQGDLGDE